MSSAEKAAQRREAEMEIQDRLPRKGPKTGEYYNPPTSDQLDHIAELLEELPDDDLDWLMCAVRADDGTLSQMSIEFWTQNFGRAADLITTMEETIRERG
jgi:hypothetical protein